MAYNKKTWVSNEIITKEALNNIENGIEAVEQSIPEKISQLENDSGYLTEHLDLSNYAEKDELHEHNNKDILDEINLVRVQAWDNAALNGGNGEESVDLSNYEKIMIDVEHDTEMKPLIGVSRNSEGNNYGYASELNMSRIEFIEASSTNENYLSKEYIFDVKDLIKTGNSGYLGFYFLRNNEGDGKITIYEIGVYKKK